MLKRGIVFHFNPFYHVFRIFCSFKVTHPSSVKRNIILQVTAQQRYCLKTELVMHEKNAQKHF